MLDVSDLQTSPRQSGQTLKKQDKICKSAERWFTAAVHLSNDSQLHLVL
jgi:hypothetical protein